MTRYAFIIVADGSVDQVCETMEDANREKRDLQAMGCSVRITRCDWEKQDRMIRLIDRESK